MCFLAYTGIILIIFQKSTNLQNFVTLYKLHNIKISFYTIITMDYRHHFYCNLAI